MNSSAHVAAVELALFDSVNLVPGMIIESALFGKRFAPREVLNSRFLGLHTGILSLLVLISTITLLFSPFLDTFAYHYRVTHMQP